MPNSSEFSAQKSNPNAGEHDQSFVRIETTPVHDNCPPRCPCPCHNALKGATPRWLHGLLDAAFIDLTGTPLLNHRSCNVKDCHGKISRSGSLTFCYLFLSWLLKTGINVTASWNSLSGIGGTWALRILHIIGDSNLHASMTVAMRHDPISNIQQRMAKYNIKSFDLFYGRQNMFTVSTCSIQRHSTQFDESNWPY